jgi:hypothetical protein
VTPPRGLPSAASWALRVGLAALLAFAGAGKLLDPAAFAEDIQNYRALPDAWAGALALGLPVLELVIAAGLLLPSHAAGASLLSGLLLLGFAVAMAQAKVRGIDLECGCFGGQSRVSWWKVLLNVGLAGLALTVMASELHRRGLSRGLADTSAPGLD